jgi:hypothetical protein
MRSITFGSASISVPRIRRIRKLHSPSVTLSLMLAIQLQTYSIKKEEPSIVSSLHEDAVPMESIASIYTKFHPLKIASQSIKLKISSAELVSVVLEKT